MPKSLLALVTLCLVLLMGAMAGIHRLGRPSEMPIQPSQHMETSRQAVPPAPELAEHVPEEPRVTIDPARVIRGTIHSGETFSAALVRHQVPPELVRRVVDGFSEVINFRRCQPGDAFALELSEEDELLRCRYERGPLEVYALEPQSDGRGDRAIRDYVEVECHVVKLSGIIDTSLFASFSTAGAGERLAQAFAEGLSSRIDFNSEVQPGDRFDVVFEKYYKDGRFLGYGRILAGRYRSPVQDVEFYYFRPDGEDSGKYYDAVGQEVGTSFLRSPLPVYRLTSSFSYRRLHPILKVYRPHTGVDLAAPVGTSVMAAADGVIHFVGWKKGFGRTVILRHPGGYKTYYGHLSRYGQGIGKKRARVHQKQIIGYVGASGLATGPHLDYRIQENGVFRNPFSMRFRPKSRLSGEALESLLRYKRQWEHLLKQEPAPYELIETREVQGRPDGWLG